MLWTVGRPDGISRRPDGCKESDFSKLKIVHNLIEEL
jgi:hypothetical protein